ncbi:hypothetical protein DOJK_02174 [Patescibacteria group bacterium]|nr:hypothetical protein DOJK_02174 [Patescibacteria group bacterium]
MTKKFLLALSFVLSLTVFNSAFAEGVGAEAAKHIETAKTFVSDQQSDPSAAITHLKNARSVIEKLQSDTPENKHAIEAISLAIIAVKSGDNAKATAALDSAIKATEQLK